VNILKAIDEYIAKGEKALAVAMIFSIVIINVLQIVLRFFHVNIPSYSTSINQVLVLWLAMVGGSLATQKAEHIKVDFASRYLYGRLKQYIMIAIDLFSMIICCFLIWYSIGFIRVEYEMGETLTTIPVRLWILQLIMPVSLSVICYRFFLLLLEEVGFSSVLKQGPEEPKEDSKC
jgi:TRAP-type C4-dicarboxylate transport system permease small subunit